MTLKLYDLCTKDPDVRLSPFCWLAKFALLHKGLDFETVPVGFADKSAYPDPNYKYVPSLDDGGALIHDSAKIVDHLEAKHPAPPLFASDGERAAHAFYAAFISAHLFPALAPLMFKRVHATVDGADADYFRKTREERFGATLEELASRPELPVAVEKALSILAAPLEAFPFYGGRQANLTDYWVASIFMWRRSVTSESLYERPEAMAAWFERMLDLFGAYARSAPRAA